MLITMLQCFSETPTFQEEKKEYLNRIWTSRYDPIYSSTFKQLILSSDHVPFMEFVLRTSAMKRSCRIKNLFRMEVFVSSYIRADVPSPLIQGNSESSALGLNHQQMVGFSGASLIPRVLPLVSIQVRGSMPPRLKHQVNYHMLHIGQLNAAINFTAY